MVAVHEAGHVVARFAFREWAPPEFSYVTNVPDSESGSAGHVSLFPPRSRLDPSVFDFLNDDELNMELSGFSQRELEAKLSILLAGEAATFIESGDRDDVGTGRENWSGDFESAMDYLERIFSVSDDVESPGNQAAYHYLESLFWRTVLLLRQPMWWEKVSAVANSLSEKRTLSFEECHGICLDDLLER